MKVNYLDINFNLSDGSYKTCTKLNNKIKYIKIQTTNPCYLLNPNIHTIIFIHPI